MSVWGGGWGMYAVHAHQVGHSIACYDCYGKKLPENLLFVYFYHGPGPTFSDGAKQTTKSLGATQARCNLRLAHFDRLLHGSLTHVRSSLNLATC